MNAARKKFDTIKEIRLRNARILAERLGKGARNKIAAKLNKEPNQISQFMGKNPTKPIGDSIARELENAFNKDLGWLDNIHDSDAIHAPVIEDVYESIPVAWEDIPKYSESVSTDSNIFLRLKVVGTSMESTDSRFNVPHGSQVILDVLAKPDHENIVIFQKDNKSPVLLRKYVVRHAYSQIVIVTNKNSDEQPITIDKNSIIHGVVRQVITVNTILPV